MLRLEKETIQWNILSFFIIKTKEITLKFQHNHKTPENLIGLTKSKQSN